MTILANCSIDNTLYTVPVKWCNGGKPGAKTSFEKIFGFIKSTHPNKTDDEIVDIIDNLDYAEMPFDITTTPLSEFAGIEDGNSCIVKKHVPFGYDHCFS